MTQIIRKRKSYYAMGSREEYVWDGQVQQPHRKGMVMRGSDPLGDVGVGHPIQ